MQVQSIQNNNNSNPSFGVKLVLRERMFPRQSYNQYDKDLLTKLVSSVENKTADKKGTVYVTGVWKDWEDSFNVQHMNVYFNNGNYNDAVTLYDIQETDLRENVNTFINTMVKLTDSFKMREAVVRSTEEARKQIEKLQSEVNAAFENVKLTVDKKLKDFDRKHFANEVLNDTDCLKPCANNFDDLRDNLADDELRQNEILKAL